jgi:hypothetical protein
VLELVYTAYDLKPFAEDMGYHGEPFPWDEARRALLRAELDAYYARLYGLTRDELRYILDPQDVYGLDFPGETFRVLKDKEIRQYGEYRTRRLVLEAWDRLEASGELPVVSGEWRAASGGEGEGKEVVEDKGEGNGGSGETVVMERSQVEERNQARGRNQVFSKNLVSGAPETSDHPTIQPSFSDFGLYKCTACGKMVMGYEKEKHSDEVHSGKRLEWKKVR